MEFLVNNFRKVLIFGLMIIIGIGTWYYYSNKPPNTEPERADLVFLDLHEVKYE